MASISRHRGQREPVIPVSNVATDLDELIEHMRAADLLNMEWFSWVETIFQEDGGIVVLYHIDYGTTEEDEEE